MPFAARVCLLLLFLSGCATTVTPRQFLDNDTAATITVVASPWIFAVDDPGGAVVRRGFLHLYAFDVNRAGTHQHYFAVMQSSFDVALPDEKSSSPTLEFQASDREMVFQSTAQDPRQLGIAQPLDQPFALESRWWYFPVTKGDVATVAQLRSPRVMLATNDARFAYIEFRDGSKELSELSATLQ
jgi:hypothetical protein